MQKKCKDRENNVNKDKRTWSGEAPGVTDQFNLLTNVDLVRLHKTERDGGTEREKTHMWDSKPMSGPRPTGPL